MIDSAKYELKSLHVNNVLDHYRLGPKAEPAKRWGDSENSLQKCELEARIDSLEYAKISPKFKIEEKIEQLRLETKKYE